MKNLNTYSFILICIFLYSCEVKTFINNATSKNDGTRTIENELRKNIKNKKTGIYIYPDLGTKISLKKGKINGVFQIIYKKDTLFYCKYIDDLPTGLYIKNFYYPQNYIHFRTLPLKPKIDYGDGSGFFNSQHKKEGFWKEKDQEGYYKNGVKQGYWEEYFTNDIEDGVSYIKKGYYKEGAKDSIWITEEFSEFEKTIKTEYFLKDSILNTSTKTTRNN